MIYPLLSSPVRNLMLLETTTPVAAKAAEGVVGFFLSYPSSERLFVLRIVLTHSTRVNSDHSGCHFRSVIVSFPITMVSFPTTWILPM
jgi:hypothetical protein